MLQIPEKPFLPTVCPDATVSTAWEYEEHRKHVFLTPCKRNNCFVCGPQKRWQLIQRISEAAPNRFLTLTVWPLHLRQKYENLNAPAKQAKFEFRKPPSLKRTIRSKRKTPPKLPPDGIETPRAAYDRTRRACSELFRWFSKQGKHADYVRILETTKQGYPHYHYLLRSKERWDQQQISGIWYQLAGSPIVDIRTINSDEAKKYVAKYLTKTDSVPFTKRRVSASRQFFPRKPAKQQMPGMLDWQFFNPVESFQLMQYLQQESALIELTPQHYVIAPHEPGLDLPPKAIEWLNLQNEPNPLDVEWSKIDRRRRSQLR